MKRDSVQNLSRLRVLLFIIGSAAGRLDAWTHEKTASYSNYTVLDSRKLYPTENNATKRKPKHLLTSAEQEVNSFDRAIWLCGESIPENDCCRQ